LSRKAWPVLTSDTLFNGKLTVYQEKEGYRFSIDAVVLAGLCRVKPSDRVVDLGTGCAVVPLILAYRNQGRELTGVEIQPSLATLAQKNVEANGFADRIRILEADFKEISTHLPPESFDLVVSNPPYRRTHSGRLNPNRQRALARHELVGSIQDVFSAGKYLLVEGGRLGVIYPAARLGHLMVTADRYGFSPKELVLIYSYASGPARLVHLECRKGGGEELMIAQPFFIFRGDGTYADSMQAIYDA
jgi:tRNA1Val (adenine37-N6)-methyltransferase